MCYEPERTGGQWCKKCFLLNMCTTEHCCWPEKILFNVVTVEVLRRVIDLYREDTSCDITHLENLRKEISIAEPSGLYSQMQGLTSVTSVYESKTPYQLVGCLRNSLTYQFDSTAGKNIKL
jgi:hypothetical protein